jgi:catechol 2,3-dioxygenase
VLIMEGMARPTRSIDPRVDIGHVHLKVADLDRALAFYKGVLGFEITQRYGNGAVFLSAGDYHHHIGLNTWESAGGPPPARGTTGLYHLAIRFPTRAALADALRRVRAAQIPLDGASDHGVSEALYLRDADGNGVELYWDRPRDEWPRASDGSLHMVTEPLDLESLVAVADEGDEEETAEQLSESTATLLRDMRSRLLTLHKALLEDARAAYEMDRGRVGSKASFLQLVINDPWFAWLHPLSGLVVRIDEVLQAESQASDADGRVLLDQVERLLSPDHGPDGFTARYYESLQRQPAVVVAHAEVRRILKQSK